MYLAIFTRFKPVTNSRGAHIFVTDGQRRATSSYDYSGNSTNHARAALEFIRKHKLLGSRWHMGGVKGGARDGYVFVREPGAVVAAREAEIYTPGGVLYLLEKRCDGEAHLPEVGGNIDDCALCAPNWGWYHIVVMNGVEMK
jgi:hypothetical protein